MSDRLQNFIQLNELAENIHATGRRVAIVLEGRDGAGKSGTVKEITQYMPPYAYRVQPSFMPSKRMMKSWLPEWKKLLPKKGQMLFMIALGIAALYYSQLWAGVLIVNMKIL